jgi:phosphatidylserine/phosphatidylglycerophosphate/cardiolipin synthase-like enzyme
MSFRSHSSGNRKRIRPTRRLTLLLALTGLIFLPYGCQMRKPLPDGLDFAGEMHPVGDIAFLADLTWIDNSGARQVDQQIFDAALEIIGAARRFIVLDMFLYNAYLGADADPTRRLSEELTDALLAQKRAEPGLEILVITDPINTVYGGTDSGQFDRLREQGIDVVTTQLEALRDSNPIYSLFWRIFVRPFGNSEGTLLPNPFGAGRVSLRSYLRLLNFKANHRKTLIADAGDGLVALVTSANPHDGSSAHTNIAIRFDGPAVLDLLATENAVLAFSGHEPLDPGRDAPASTLPADITLQVLTEKKIKDAVVAAIDAAVPDDALSLAMFYLSDRMVIRALKSAAARGVRTRVLLDPNKDAFGRVKQGIPARPVAEELHRAGVPVRWCDTHGEQCHMKMLLVDYADGASTLIAGSANFTRRNLENFNLETDVAVRGPPESAVLIDARDFFDRMWSNAPNQRISTEYATYADQSMVKRLLYRFMEGSGISTF